MRKNNRTGKLVHPAPLISGCYKVTHKEPLHRALKPSTVRHLRSRHIVADIYRDGQKAAHSPAMHGMTAPFSFPDHYKITPQSQTVRTIDNGYHTEEFEHDL